MYSYDFWMLKTEFSFPLHSPFFFSECLIWTVILSSHTKHSSQKLWNTFFLDNLWKFYKNIPLFPPFPSLHESDKFFPPYWFLILFLVKRDSLGFSKNKFASWLSRLNPEDQITYQKCKKMTKGPNKCTISSIVQLLTLIGHNTINICQIWTLST